MLQHVYCNLTTRIVKLDGGIYMEKNSSSNFTQHFETVIYIFIAYRTVMHSLTFGTPQIITIILNNLQFVHVSQRC